MEKRVTVLNCPVDVCDMDYALGMSYQNILENKNFHVVTINPEMIMNAQKNEAFKEILNNSSLNIADGVGVKIALKLKKINQNHLRGIDFSRNLLKLASEKNLKVALIGAKQEILEKAIEEILSKYPSLNIVYSKNGYFNNEEEIINEVSALCPQIMLVALGSPYQEEFIVKLKEKVQGCTMVGVGGSFDVFSGNVKEAPKIFQKLGLEWLYRTILQPERIKRIFPVLPLFLIKCIISSINKKV